MRSVCFLHVPKTSGTSVTLYLESQFEANAVCPARSGDEFAALGPAKLRNFAMFRAECDASVIDVLPPATPVVTMLREPMARAHSYWRYIQRLPEHRLHEQFQREHGTFEHFLNAMPSNPVSKLLAAPSGRPPRGLWEQTCDMDDDELLAHATARLESFAFVGLAERHDEAVAQIAHLLGWAPPGRLPVTNAAPPLPTVYEASRAERAVFDGRNRVDVALYRRAAEMFERRARLTDETTRQALYAERVATGSSELSERRVIDLCSPIFGAGWLRVIDTELGSMRPIGVGGEASVDVPVILGRFTTMKVTCPAFSSELALASLEIEVNGQPVRVSRRIGADGVTLDAALPPSGPGDRFTRITFRSGGGVDVPPNHTGALTNLVATVGISRIELIPHPPGSLRVTSARLLHNAGAGPAPPQMQARRMAAAPT